MIFSTLYLLFGIASAGVVELPDGLILEWTFLSDTEISFSYTVPDEITQNYGWVGLGFKFKEEGGSMTNADIVNIIFDQPVADSYADNNGRPDPDTSIGGTEDIAPTFTSTTGEGTTIYSWTRVVNTGDQYDKEFIVDEEYYALWAYGEVNDEGKQMQHLTGNRGKCEFVLTKDTATTTSFLTFIH